MKTLLSLLLMMTTTALPAFAVEFPPPPAPKFTPKAPVFKLSPVARNCGYFARAAGDRLTLGKIDQPVTYILVHKAGRRMAIFHGDKIMKEYKIALGFNPRGHKEEKGDGRTPEGKYFIDFKNPKSSYHLSLKVSYPNADDLRRAMEKSQKPGDDIMIHGWPNMRSQRELIPKIHEFDKRRAFPDRWTAGCIAVHDKEIEEIYARTELKTPIEICP